MNKKFKYKIAYTIAMVVPIVGFLLCFIAAYISGTRENWYGFGLSLLFCGFNLIMLLMVFLSYKMDIRFDGLEELIREQQEKQNRQ
jgi:hypothetical protein